MIKIPKLSNPEDLKYREKAWLFEVYEELKHTSKAWFIVMLLVIAASAPLYSVLKKKFADSLIAGYMPPAVNQDVLKAKPLIVARAAILPVSENIYSAYAQVVNPNANLLVRSFSYEFTFKNAAGETLKTTSGESFMAQGQSRFVIQPAVEMAREPASVNFTITKTRFTSSIPEFIPKFEILQQKSGSSEDGNFFAEGIVKNPYSFTVKKISVQVLVFDIANRSLLAVNNTLLSDFKPFEGRYFHVMWPVGADKLFKSKPGQIQVIAEVNPLDQGLAVPQ